MSIPVSLQEHSSIHLLLFEIAMVTLRETVHRSKKNKRKLRLRKDKSELTPNDHHARDAARVAQFQIDGKKYAKATTKAINRVKRSWKR
jgi:hypothetical protein